MTAALESSAVIITDRLCESNAGGPYEGFCICTASGGRGGSAVTCLAGRSRGGAAFPASVGKRVSARGRAKTGGIWIYL